MSTTVEIKLEVESGLTNNAIESSFAEQFPEEGVVSVNAFDTPEIEQRPKNGEIVNTEWVDMRNYLVDVDKDGETFREYYTFASIEALNEED